MREKESLPLDPNNGVKVTSGLNYQNTGEGKAGGKTLTELGPTEKSSPAGKSPLKQ